MAIPSRRAPNALSIALLLAPLLAPLRAQEDPDETEPVAPKAGPAIRYVDAFPSQAPFQKPLFVAFTATDPEGAYVVTQPGQVLRVPLSAEDGRRRIFLDLSTQVLTENWEEGLLGFQFDPNYAENGFVYVYWSERTEMHEQAMAHGKAKSDRRSVVSRFATHDLYGHRSVDPHSELRLLEVFQPFGNHNGGTILFGPDGMLYVALGDGGAAHDPFCNGESLEVLLGKVLRIDVRGATTARPYTVPADNPFVDRDQARGEIWCYGLRNVWRMAFDRATGELWAGDVGQDRIEEVDVLVKGGFYGWNSFEGNERFERRSGERPTPPDPIEPIATYPHRDGLSITGGHVYRGTAIPALQGFYVYGDFMTRRMWACRRGSDGAPTEVMTLPACPPQPSSFAEQPDGELLVTCFLGKKGRVYRLTAE